MFDALLVIGIIIVTAVLSIYLIKVLHNLFQRLKLVMGNTHIAVTKMNKIKLAGIGLTILAFTLFYWFQIRPSQIRKGCHRWIVDMPGEIEDQLGYAPARAKYDALYSSCLHREGLW